MHYDVCVFAHLPGYDEALDEFDLFIDTRTVDVHLRWQRRQALNGNQRPNLIQTVHAAGYALDSSALCPAAPAATPQIPSRRRELCGPVAFCKHLLPPVTAIGTRPMSPSESASRETLTRQQRNMALAEPIARLSQDRRMILKDASALAERLARRAIPDAERDRVGRFAGRYRRASRRRGGADEAGVDRETGRRAGQVVLG